MWWSQDPSATIGSFVSSKVVFSAEDSQSLDFSGGLDDQGFLTVDHALLVARKICRHQAKKFIPKLPDTALTVTARDGNRTGFEAVI